MIKAVLIDMDETLLIDHHVPEINQKAIQEARKKGTYIVAATGRPFSMLQEILEEMGTKGLSGQYSICFNGAAMYENNNSQPIYCESLSFSQIKASYDICVRHHLCFLAFTLDMVYIFNPTQSEIERKNKQHAVFQIVDDLKLLENKTVIKISIQSDEEDLLYKIGKEEQDAFANVQMEVSFSSRRYLECTCKGISKASALIRLRDHLHLKREEVMAIGDNFNDIEMLKEAGLGVCVGDGRDEAKAAADVVMKQGYREGAVAVAIERYVLEK